MGVWTLLFGLTRAASPTLQLPPGQSTEAWAPAARHAGLTLVDAGAPADFVLQHTSAGWVLVRGAERVPVAPPRSPDHREDIALLAVSMARAQSRRLPTLSLPPPAVVAAEPVPKPRPPTPRPAVSPPKPRPVTPPPPKPVPDQVPARPPPSAPSAPLPPPPPDPASPNPAPLAVSPPPATALQTRWALVPGIEVRPHQAAAPMVLAEVRLQVDHRVYAALRPALRASTALDQAPAATRGSLGVGLAAGHRLGRSTALGGLIELERRTFQHPADPDTVLWRGRAGPLVETLLTRSGPVQLNAQLGLTTDLQRTQIAVAGADPTSLSPLSVQVGLGGVVFRDSLKTGEIW